jgi:hypothetical protein
VELAKQRSVRSGPLGVEDDVRCAREQILEPVPSAKLSTKLMK